MCWSLCKGTCGIELTSSAWAAHLFTLYVYRNHRKCFLSHCCCFWAIVPQCTPTVFGSAGDHTSSCSHPPTELCPQLRIDSAHLECRAVCIFPLTVNKPRQVLFLRVLQNYFSCVLFGIEAEGCCSAGGVLARCARRPGFEPCTTLNQVWLCLPVILVFRG